MVYDKNTGKEIEMSINGFNERNWRLHAFLMPHVEDSIYRHVNCKSIMSCIQFRHIALWIKRKQQDKNGTWRVFPKTIQHCVNGILKEIESDNSVPFASSEVRDMEILFDCLKTQKILN